MSFDESLAADTPEPDAITAAKHAARQRAREVRDCLDLDVCREHAASIATALSELRELGRVTTVLTYAALPAELDPSLAIDALRARGVRIAYTRIEGEGVLVMHEVSVESELIPGPLAIRQPSPDSPVVAHDAIDAVILPGVAFSEDGARLGYGGGYFDRLLPMLRRDCARIGVAFDEQILSEIPMREHDQHVDVIVTPTRVIRPPRRARMQL
ncbi:MAG: 5-formyltetrahydrofolate cyclo-ligase [Coriobacteriia bacterium]|nr:5-formyltetrahydrofolate cyclo-ligase [Coriobacteriia bacterium]